MNTPILLCTALSTLSAAQNNSPSSLLIKVLLLLLGILVVIFLIMFIKKKISPNQNDEDSDFIDNDSNTASGHANTTSSQRLNFDKKTNVKNSENSSHKHRQTLLSSGMQYDTASAKRYKSQSGDGFGVGFSERDGIPEQADTDTVELTVSHDGSWILPDDISNRKSVSKKTDTKNSDDCYRNDSIFFGDDYF